MFKNVFVRILSSLILLFILFSCNSGNKVKFQDKLFSDFVAEMKINSTNIHFDFEAKKNTLFYENGLEIKASLINKNKDTVYILSTTCSGESNFLDYDTLLFSQYHLLQCNASFPYILKIAPNEKFTFGANFQNFQNSNEMKLGLYLNLVNKSFDITKIELFEVYKMAGEKKNIIRTSKKIS